MERYNEYKDSGVQWLGEIPSHWELRKMKYTFCERSQKGFPNEPLLAATQNHGVIKKSDYENRTVEATKNLDTLKLVEKGDFVISLRSFQGGIEYSYCRGIISPAYTVLKAHHLTEPYFKHLAKSPSFIDLLKSSVTGIREGQNIDYNKLKVEFMPIPTIEEQQAIATYLDTITAKIDEAIVQQQKMIDLLNERKQIIINNAVTKGLNPDAPMKDSGVDWIGEIPEHWEITKLKKKSKIILGKMLSNAPGNKYEYFCAKDVHYGCADDSDLKQMFFSDTEREQYKVNYGDMLIVEGGAGAGGCAIYKGTKTAYIQNSIMIVRGNEDMVNEYICSFMQSINQRGYVEFICNKATIPHFTKEKAGGVNIAVPPIEEQNKIVKYIEKMCAPIDNAISSAAKQISLLQERKQIIINDVVTGKVKVS